MSYPIHLTSALLLLLAFVPGLQAEDGETADAASAPLAVEELVDQLQKSVVTIQASGRDGEPLSMGTGFVIDASGIVATNLHVIPEGRPIAVQLRPGKSLDVLAIDASDNASDLALLRVDPGDESLTALPLAPSGSVRQGQAVLAFGNPLGLRNSVVRGIVSAIRDVGNQQMIQLAMPIQPGNSGGPLVDLEGRVHGIVNMKSAVDDNLGFAVPVSRLQQLRANPNPIPMDRWVRLSRINTDRWTPLFGSDWRQRAGVISASAAGEGFGGRALCLAKELPPAVPFEIAVDVRLEDEAGAAGLVFHSDGDNLHYGFYPSAGNLRLSCFRGPSVFSWQVLSEITTPHYEPGQWNRLKVRVEQDRIRCFVNGHQVIETDDQTFSEGRVGLAKFRDTTADFRRWRVGRDLAEERLSDWTRDWIAEAASAAEAADDPPTADLQSLVEQDGAAAARELERQAFRLQQQAERLRRVADDVRVASVVAELRQVIADASEDRLVRGALLIAKLDAPDLDIDIYLDRLEGMAEEVRAMYADNADSNARLAALNRYLFEENGFHGGRAEYYHPANSHLDRVIDDREGLPITLSILYMDLGRRLDIALEGVGLPGHFVVRHVDGEETGQLIDVFERANLLSRSDAERVVREYAGRPLEAADLTAQDDQQILTRVVHNLIGSARRDDDTAALQRYTEALVGLNPEEPRYRLMRAIILHQTNRDGRALEDLDWLIETSPAGVDVQQVQQMRTFLQERVER